MRFGIDKERSREPALDEGSGGCTCQPITIERKPFKMGELAKLRRNGSFELVFR